MAIVNINKSNNKLYNKKNNSFSKPKPKIVYKKQQDSVNKQSFENLGFSTFYKHPDDPYDFPKHNIFGMRNFLRKHKFNQYSPGDPLEWKQLMLQFLYEPDYFVHIKITLNNTFVTVIRKNGEVLISASGGKLGFKGPKRSTSYCSYQVGMFISLKLRELTLAMRDEYKSEWRRRNPHMTYKNLTYVPGFVWIIPSIAIVLKRTPTGKLKSCLNGLTSKFRFFKYVQYQLSTAHNGVRPRKPKRV